ncbi:MAG: DHH family phosphoesterase [Nitrosarchaeum sp.]|nr:DHH family phosphoesterase [Nitrosarchaeum sp.]
MSDWHLTSVTDAFAKAHPELLSPRIKNPATALYDTRLGSLSRIISFALKGKVADFLTCIKILSRIENPYEILDQVTPRGKYVRKRAERLEKEYQEALASALATPIHKHVLHYHYKEHTASITAELSNELLHRKPRAVILVSRDVEGITRLSLRIPQGLHDRYGIQGPALLERAYLGTQGSGGGHPLACGGHIPTEQFPTALAQLQDAVLEAFEQKATVTTPQ